MIEYILVLFMNGWPVEVDRFAKEEECVDKMKTFERALKQAKSEARVWCETRPRKALI